jgi:hypothetical protein
LAFRFADVARFHFYTHSPLRERITSVPLP